MAAPIVRTLRGVLRFHMVRPFQSQASGKAASQRGGSKTLVSFPVKFTAGSEDSVTGEDKVHTVPALAPSVPAKPDEQHVGLGLVKDLEAEGSDMAVQTRDEMPSQEIKSVSKGSGQEEPTSSSSSSSSDSDSEDSGDEESDPQNVKPSKHESKSQVTVGEGAFNGTSSQSVPGASHAQGELQISYPNIPWKGNPPPIANTQAAAPPPARAQAAAPPPARAQAAAPPPARAQAAAPPPARAQAAAPPPARAQAAAPPPARAQAAAPPPARAQAAAPPPALAQVVTPSLPPKAQSDDQMRESPADNLLAVKEEGHEEQSGMSGGAEQLSGGHSGSVEAKEEFEESPGHADQFCPETAPGQESGTSPPDVPVTDLPFDNSHYQNLQHHTYTSFTFVDYDVELSLFRLPQPSSGRPSPRH